MQPDDIIVVAEGQRVYVSGEVKTPGRYLYEKGLTVDKAISMAGGWTEKAERGTIKLTRVTTAWPNRSTCRWMRRCCPMILSWCRNSRKCT